MARREVTVHQVDVFTETPFTGNPAGVVIGAEALSDGEMQAIARELANPETAFVLPPRGADHDLFLRYFTPTTEVPSCGHATVAAHYVRSLDGLTLPATVVHRNAARRQRVDLRLESGRTRVTVHQGPWEARPPLADEAASRVMAALGLAPGDRDPRCPVRIATTGHSKVLVGVRTAALLDAIEPDAAALVRLSAELGSSGFHVFTLDAASAPGCQALCRMFAPAIGIPEDPVTGNGNGPLGGYLAEHGLLPAAGPELRFRARQGVKMGRPGEVDVAVRIAAGRPDAVAITGSAVRLFSARLTL